MMCSGSDRDIHSFPYRSNMKFTALGAATVYAALIIVIGLTTLLSPLALKWFYERNARELIHEVRKSKVFEKQY